MTEADWLSCTDPRTMLKFYGNKLSKRKLRLFAVACCRQVWNELSDERLKSMLEINERFADGLMPMDAMQNAQTLASDALDEIYSDANEQRWYYIQKYAAEAVFKACGNEMSEAVVLDVITLTNSSVLANVKTEDETVTRQREDGIKAAWLRDIVGNPFRTMPLDPTWNDGTLRKMAQRLYDSRRFGEIRTLPDALMDAGCQDEEIFSHCRNKEPHTLGCWVLDLLLNKK